MQSFSISIGAVLVTLAAAVSGQYTYNETTGVFTCATANAAYCAGDSLSTNIIIRCNGFTGQSGNCNDNLSGLPPVGVNYAPCWQSSPTAGNAACSKNCIVYGGGNGTFTLPSSICVPATTTTNSTSTAAGSASLTTVTTSPTSSTPPRMTTSTVYATSVITISSCAPTVSKCPYTSEPIVTTMTFAVSTTVCPVSSSTASILVPSPISVSFASTSAPVSVAIPTTSLFASAATHTQPGIPIITASGTGGVGSGPGNSTVTKGNGGSGSATATPVGPNSSPSTARLNPAYTGAAVANRASPALVAIGFFVAHLL